MIDMKRITPKPEVIENPNENKPLPFMKRFAYTIIDFGTTALLFFGLYQLALHTPISSNLNKALAEMTEIQIETGENTGFFIKTYLEEGQTTNATTYKDDGGVYFYATKDEFKQDYLNALNSNQTYKDLKFNYTVNSFAISASSLAIAEINFFLIVPLTNKRRATLGLLFANGQMISKKYVSKARWYQILGRTAFILIIDSLPLLFFVGEGILMVVPVVTLLVTFTNKERRTLHDLVTGIKIIDKTTYVPLVDHEVTDNIADKVE